MSAKICMPLNAMHGTLEFSVAEEDMGIWPLDNGSSEDVHAASLLLKAEMKNLEIFVSVAKNVD